MKRYLQFSIATLCLVVAVLIGFHLGQKDARAQTPGQIIGVVWDDFRGGYSTLYDSGDVYFRRPDEVHEGAYNRPEFKPEWPLHYVGNLYDAGIPVPVESETIGGVKGKYK